jgi:hypothetical protein
MINQMYMSPNRLIDVQYQALTYRAFTSFPHSLIPSFLHLFDHGACPVAPPPGTGLSTVSFGSFRFAPFPKRMPLPSLARAGND